MRDDDSDDGRIDVAMEYVVSFCNEKAGNQPAEGQENDPNMLNQANRK